MEKFIVEGGRTLHGCVRVHGAKNAVLPILAATILARGKSVLHNCPALSDVDVACKILTYLGAKITREGATLIVDTDAIDKCDIPEKMMHEMRSSIIFLAPLAARMHRAVLCAPGGCEIGLRPIDLHLYGLNLLGMQAVSAGSCIRCSVQALHGEKIILPFPSVGATENIMIAAAVANGVTTLINAAREPEIEDLARFLNACGARIRGAGTGTIEITGVSHLHAAEHTVIPDRILACTLLCCAAATHSEITLQNVCVAHLNPVMPMFYNSGCRLRAAQDRLQITPPRYLKKLGQVKTMPYPGFPTDCQAPVMALACVAHGTSVFVENIFENRYRHVPELKKLGARIDVNDKVAVVEGVQTLSGTRVRATDLRGGAALVVAALAADGVTEITDIRHIDRGYEKMEIMLRSLGAQIVRDGKETEKQPLRPG